MKLCLVESNLIHRKVKILASSKNLLGEFNKTNDRRVAQH